MRQYQKAWLTLRKKGVLQIVAHPKHHARIKKAISKEKWMDLGFRMELQEAEKTATVISKSGSKENPALLTLTLTYSIGVDDV